MTADVAGNVVRIALVDEAVALSTVSRKPDVEGIEVRELTIDGRRWALVDYAPGARREEWCADGHLGVVVSGQIQYEFEGGGMPLDARQGDAFTLSTGRGHRGRNLGESVTTVLVIDDPA